MTNPDENCQDAAVPTLYIRLGGADGIRRLVDRFYDLMEQESAFAPLLALHPHDLGETRDKLFAFFSGWSGGPDLFVRQYGHPRLRARHLGIKITSVERDMWLRCMAFAMVDVQVDPAIQDRLLQSLFDVADFMRNRPDDTAAN